MIGRIKIILAGIAARGWRAIAVAALGQSGLRRNQS
jgi:hypothetical protein